MKGEITKKLGNITEIVGYLLTYGTIVIVYFGIYMQFENESFEYAIYTVFVSLLVFIIWHFIGRVLYTLYSSYLKYINEEKSFKKFRLHWYASFAIITILWSLFLFLFIGYITGAEIGDLDEIGFFSLIFLPFIIPQTILHYKTFNIVKFPFQIKFKTLKIIKMFKLDKLEKNEIIIISLIIGAVLSLLFGYLFCSMHYYKWSKGNLIEVYYKTKQENCVFNYVIALGTFIVVGGFLYIFLNRKSEGSR